MHNFRNIKIWSESIDLAEKVYILTKSFPADEKYGLISQMRRSAASIPSNIAEGSSRRSQKEFQHYLSISLGSAFELGTQLELSNRLKMISNELKDELSKEIELIERKIYSFSKQLK
jgi:four helix bundle protein